MRIEWRAQSNPVRLWWGMLVLVGSTNIALWFLLYLRFGDRPAGSGAVEFVHLRGDFFDRRLQA